MSQAYIHVAKLIMHSALSVMHLSRAHRSGLESEQVKLTELTNQLTECESEIEECELKVELLRKQLRLAEERHNQCTEKRSALQNQVRGEGSRANLIEVCILRGNFGTGLAYVQVWNMPFVILGGHIWYAWRVYASTCGDV